MSDLAADLDVMAEFGVAQVNSLSFDPDRNRTFDQLAMLTVMAAERGIGTTIELAPGMTIGDPATVLAAIEHVGRPDLRLAVDTMHWVRSGCGTVELHELGPEKIGYVQLSDTTLKPRVKSYMEEAMYEDGAGRRGASARRNPRSGAGRCGDRSRDSDAGPGRIRHGPHGAPSTRCGGGS